MGVKRMEAKHIGAKRMGAKRMEAKRMEAKRMEVKTPVLTALHGLTASRRLLRASLHYLRACLSRLES